MRIVRERSRLPSCLATLVITRVQGKARDSLAVYVVWLACHITTAPRLAHHQSTLLVSGDDSLLGESLRGGNGRLALEVFCHWKEHQPGSKLFPLGSQHALGTC